MTNAALPAPVIVVVEGGADALDVLRERSVPRMLVAASLLTAL
jgi:hypothetical protein